MDGEQISANHSFLFDTARYDFVGFLTAGDNSAFALAGTQLYAGNIEVRQNIDDVPSTTQNSQMAIYGSYAGLISSLRLNYGLTLKWVTYSMYTEQADGGGIDLGFAKRLLLAGNQFGKRITVDTGFAFQNLAQVGVKMIDETEPLPLAIKFGITTGITLFPKYIRKRTCFFMIY